MPIASPFRLLTSRPGNQNDSGAIGALARTFPENCMTMHDAEARPNLHFLSFPVQSEPEPKKTRFHSCFTYENEGMAGGGIEPPTRGFSVHCSAN